MSSFGNNLSNFKLFADPTRAPLDTVSKLNLFGLAIDRALSFKAHIKWVCNKVHATVASLRRVRKFVPINVMIGNL